MTDPYRFRDDLPHDTLRLANLLDGDDRDLPESDKLPIGADTRFEATVRLLQDLEERRGIDVLRLLLELEDESNLGTDDVERAIHREAALKRHNESDTRRGGRPSKVDKLAGRIETHCRIAERGDYEGADDQIRARDRQISVTLQTADISRRTYYNLRDRVLDDQGIDISEIAPPSEVVTA